MLSSSPSETNELKKGLGVSLGLHLLIAGLFLVNMIFFSKPLIDLSQAISVTVSDMKPNVHLPPKAQAPEAPNEPAPVATAKKELPPKKFEKPLPKENEISLNKSKLKQKEALNKLKKLSALEKIKQDVKSDAAAAVPVVKAEAKPRVIAPGAQLTGLDKMDADAYLAQIDQSIKKSWALPQWLLNKPLNAKILVKFNTDGNIISTKIISSSGNSSYDDYCSQAINKAAPFPKVPDKFSEKFGVDGVIIGFPE